MSSLIPGTCEVSLPSLHQAENRDALSLCLRGKDACFRQNSSKIPSLMLALLGRFIFSGALVPKQIKRLLKMRGLSAVVARDAESVQTMDKALDVVRARSAV